MKVLFIYRTAREGILSGYFKKTHPSTMLYGLVELRKKGVTVNFSDRAYSHLNILRYILQPFETLFIKLIQYPLGYKLHQALIMLPEYHKYDVIVCTQDSAGLPVLMLKKLGLINKKIIYICNNLVPLLRDKSNAYLRKFFLWHLQAADSIVCLSKVEKDIINKYLSPKAIHIPFGVDTKFFTPVATKYKYEILAVGRDILRDYSTLTKAIGNSEWKTAIVCSKNNLKSLLIPLNIDVFYDISPLELKRLYAKSKIVLIPMKNSVPKSQGQVVFLEATAMNKTVIASDVLGLTTAFDIKRYENLSLVKPGDPQNLHEQIARSLNNNSIRNFVNKPKRKLISMERFAQDLYKILNNL